MSEIDTSAKIRLYRAQYGRFPPGIEDDLLDEIDRLRAERDAALEKLGECHAGYETLERQLAAARSEALREAASLVTQFAARLPTRTPLDPFRRLHEALIALASAGGEKGESK